MYALLIALRNCFFALLAWSYKQLQWDFLLKNSLRYVPIVGIMSMCAILFNFLTGTKVNKADLIAVVAARLKTTQKSAALALDAVLESIQEGLISGDGEVRLVGFGTFVAQSVRAKRVRNPQNGKIIEVPATRRPRFRPGAKLSQAVSGKA